jgi:UDP-N-acetylmuramoyl-L-alanyl-D-glutamate--2,6-diaminopimelate ligase
MAEVACEYSDKVIFTSDNPRSEDPHAILKDMEAGCKCGSKKKSISLLQIEEKRLKQQLAWHKKKILF